MQYDVTDHALLSADAQKLDSDQLEAHGTIAERVLGLAGTALTGKAALEAASYVAMQINLQVQLESVGGVVSESKGGQSFTYATVNGKRVAVSDIALLGVRALIMPAPATSNSQPNTFVW